MKENIEKRLALLQEEFSKGKTMMEELDQKKANLEKTLLRIEGAIQVLQEELNKMEAPVQSSSETEE